MSVVPDAALFAASKMMGAGLFWPYSFRTFRYATAPRVVVISA